MYIKCTFLYTAIVSKVNGVSAFPQYVISHIHLPALHTLMQSPEQIHTLLNCTLTVFFLALQKAAIMSSAIPQLAHTVIFLLER